MLPVLALALMAGFPLAETHAQEWAWLKGSDGVDSPGVSGIKGVESPDNTPGCRKHAASWTDKDGNFWLFGGSVPGGSLNDLWKFNIQTRNWVWMSGSIAINQYGTYGTFRVEDDGNQPGSRAAPSAWTDEDGNLWLFGGVGYGAVGLGWLNDLWRYNIATGKWTWMKGGSQVSVPAVFGTQGVEDPSNRPGGKAEAACWTDQNGDLWLFGGHGHVPNAFGPMNDLWKYSIATGNWTWIKGSAWVWQYSIYNTIGVESASSTPGRRWGSAYWTDPAGNLWLFGGHGSGEATDGYLNDLWKFNVATGNWIWMHGAKIAAEYGAYGVKGIPASTNCPGARYLTASWSDGDGNLYLFGGQGHAATLIGYMNDIWKYHVATGEWTWMYGSDGTDLFGVYGSKGVASPSNIPGSRRSCRVWGDAYGRPWFFGGEGYSASSFGQLNDFWGYAPVAVCRDVTVLSDPTGFAMASVDNGSYDPENDPIVVTQLPPGPYPVGTTTVTLVVTDSKNDLSTCGAFVTVVDIRCGQNNNKVLVCHDGNSLCISPHALQAHLDHGDTPGHCPVQKHGDPTAAISPERLSVRNYPNPFGPSSAGGTAGTVISYALETGDDVRLTVLDSYGREVATLVEEKQEAGVYSTEFRPASLPSGMYRYALRVGNVLRTGTMVYLK